MTDTETMQVIAANGATLALISDAETTETVEFGIFNDPEWWEPMFASGEIPETQRFQLENPMWTTLSGWSAWKYAFNLNEDRARHAKIDKYGPVIIRRRVVVETPWAALTDEQLDEIRR